jgi:hypothetical protein
MADNLSDYAENKLLDHLLGRTSFTMPATVRVALFTTATTDAGGGTEVTGGAYARQPLTIDAASGGATQNSAEIVFPVATANWGTISHVAIYDAATAGNSLMHGALAASRIINTGEQLRIPVADLDFALS